MQPTRAAPVLCLASASPRRRELLHQIGVPHSVSVPDIDETAQAAEAPSDYVTRMARSKAQAVQVRGSPLPVLAADTIVVCDGLILGKPAGEAEGVAMLERLAGRSHEVMTAVALAQPAGLALRLSASRVRFRAMSRAECLAYWHTGEPRDKAGAYAVQGRGAVFIEHLSGSYSGVMGLPLYETAQLLQAAGIPVIAPAPRRDGPA
ncbi:MAG TPA: Maf family protein [Steroidobacteraceae bacterium]|nr:Maf family protein [Steroidobacteraceae bacterium]